MMAGTGTGQGQDREADNYTWDDEDEDGKEHPQTPMRTTGAVNPDDDTDTSDKQGPFCQLLEGGQGAQMTGRDDKKRGQTMRTPVTHLHCCGAT